MADLRHDDYPHHAGYLLGCQACEAKCRCKPGRAPCVWEGHVAAEYEAAE